jgi:hypothetical protein
MACPNFKNGPKKGLGPLGVDTCFQQNFPWAHTELEFDVLGVHGKLVKYVDHLSKWKVEKKKMFPYTSCPNCNQLVFGLKEF